MPPRRLPAKKPAAVPEAQIVAEAKVSPVLKQRIFPGGLTVLEFNERIRMKLYPEIETARLVMTGKFDQKGTAVLQAVYIGMRRSRQPECVAALAHLAKNKMFKEVPWQKLQEEPKWR